MLTAFLDNMEPSSQIVIKLHLMNPGLGNLDSTENHALMGRKET